MKKLILSLVLVFSIASLVLALVCTKCNQNNTDGTKFCTNCGTKFEPVQPVKPAFILCSQCGHKNIPAAKFCTRCGNKIISNAPTVQTAPVKPVQKAETKKPSAKPVKKQIKMEDTTRNYGIGLNYPGISFKYIINSKYALEGKYQSGDGIALYGSRMYSCFAQGQNENLSTFFGVELDLISFKNDISEGSGYAFEVFAGGEYFISNRLALEMDFGPAYISLNDERDSLSQSGLEMVFNIGVNCYFGRSEK